MTVGAKELGLRAGDVGDRMQSNRLADDTAPSRVERAQDIAVGLGRRRRREQKRVLKPQPVNVTDKSAAMGPP